MKDQQQPETIQIQSGMFVVPTPVATVLDHIPPAQAGNETGLVVFRVEHATGTSVYFLGPDHAETIARQLAHHALQCRSSLQVAAAGALNQLPNLDPKEA